MRGCQLCDTCQGGGASATKIALLCSIIGKVFRHNANDAVGMPIFIWIERKKLYTVSVLRFVLI